jgi:hypothetical protein
MMNKILLAVASALILSAASELIKWVEKRLKEDNQIPEARPEACSAD